MGFIIGAIVGIGTILCNYSVLNGLNVAEMICTVLWIMVIWGIFGILSEWILKTINYIYTVIKNK